MKTIKYKRYKKLVDIPIESLVDDNIECVMLDIDSSLLIWRGKNVGKEEIDWCNSVKEQGIEIILVSNAHKPRAHKIAQQINSNYISPAFKPWPFGLMKAAKMSSSQINNCIMIGDQILTDRLAAALAGIKFILLEPLSNVEFGVTKINRLVEKHILGRKDL